MAIGLPVNNYIPCCTKSQHRIIELLDVLSCHIY